MAEDQGAAVAEEQQELEFEYPIRIEDAGPGAKKVWVEIPRQRIDEELEKQFKELRQQAALPGFRPGHAPKKLIEKRFSADVNDQVRRALIAESYEQAVKKNDLQVIGEPEFEDPDAIKLPEEGALSYCFTVEVRPHLTLPDLANLRVKKPRIDIKEENVDQAMRNLREQQGMLVPVEDRGVEEGDFLIADVHVKLDGQTIGHQHDAQLVARPGRVAGLQVNELGKQLVAMNPGETRTITVRAPADFPNAQLRDRDVRIEIALKDIKRMELVEVTPEFLADLGFNTEQELRGALRDQMEQKITADVQQAMRDQISRYLLENTQVELPANYSNKQVERAVSRRSVDLMMRGVPREQVQASVERLRHGAREDIQRELKLFFILQNLADAHKVEVDESELNGRIAAIAAQNDERPEKLKQQMARDGSLLSLFIQMREQRAIDNVLSKVQIEEVELGSKPAAT